MSHKLNICLLFKKFTLCAVNFSMFIQVGGQEMYENHQKLKTARERGRELELNYTRTKEHLEQERTKNQRLEQDVKNFRERQKYLENIKTLQMKKPWVVGCEGI